MPDEYVEVVLPGHELALLTWSQVLVSLVLQSFSFSKFTIAEKPPSATHA